MIRISIFTAIWCVVATASTAVAREETSYASHMRSGLRTRRYLSSKSSSSASVDRVKSKSTKAPTVKSPKSSKGGSVSGGKKGSSSDGGNKNVSVIIDKIHADAATDNNSTTDTVALNTNDTSEETEDTVSANSTVADIHAASNAPDNTVSPTSSPTAGVTKLTVTTSPTLPSSDTTTQRTVQLLHPNVPNECLAYDESAAQATVRMIECTSAATNGTQLDHWEMLTKSTDLFYLRHVQSQLCIPMNPEFPDQPFDCFRYSGQSEAVADSLNGLVDCDSGFAATMGSEDDGALYLYNEECLAEIEPGHETDIILMSYRRGHVENGTQIALWGERMLMEMDHLVKQHNFQANWTLIDV